MLSPYSPAKFLSTPSARRATVLSSERIRAINISIHALREEGDFRAVGAWNAASSFLSTPSARRATDMILNTKPDGVISIHALREEGDAGSPGSFLG